MARIRTIKPEFQQSESMGRVCRDARLLFILLWPICDDEGRTRANPRMLSSLLFPYDEDAQLKIVEWLFELEREKCIQLYDINGNAYLQIESWKSHQRIDKAFPSRIAPPPIQERSRTTTKPRRERSALERNGMEGTKDQGTDQGTESAERATASPVIQIPTNRQDEEYPVSQAQADEFVSLYPNVDVLKELRGMRGWSLTNPTKRKTMGGMPKFMNGWLEKEQDKNDRGRTGTQQQGRGTRAAAEHSLAAIKRTEGGDTGGGALEPTDNPRCAIATTRAASDSGGVHPRDDQARRNLPVPDTDDGGKERSQSGVPRRFEASPALEIIQGVPAVSAEYREIPSDAWPIARVV